ncbi:hypothetical protein R6Z07F_015062 [Ovis aries]
MRAAPAPPGLAGLVRAHARCPPEASGCAERARAARRRTCEVSLEEREGGYAESAAWGASTPHLEAPRVPAEPVEHPTQGRILTQDPKALVALQPLWALTLPLECLGGFDFCHCDLQIQEIHLWKRELLPQDHRRTQQNIVFQEACVRVNASENGQLPPSSVLALQRLPLGLASPYLSMYPIASALILPVLTANQEVSACANYSEMNGSGSTM